QLSAFGAEHRRTENLIRVRINYGFHEPASFADFDGARHLAHRQLRDANVSTLQTRIPLGHANTSQLRIDIYDVRNQAAARGGIAAFNQIGPNDPKVVI